MAVLLGIHLQLPGPATPPDVVAGRVYAPINRLPKPTSGCSELRVQNAELPEGPVYFTKHAKIKECSR